MKVTMQDVRAAKMCSRGARLFLKRHGVDWSEFLAEGVDAEKLIATGDAMALRVVRKANVRRR